MVQVELGKSSVYTGMSKQTVFCFLGNLNDFLSLAQRGKEVVYEFSGKPSFKDAIEAIGVPHPEIGSILVSGKPVSWHAHVVGGEKVEVLPLLPSTMYEGQDQAKAPDFVLDVHLGGLARRLRMLGFDALYNNTFEDSQLVEIAEADGRILLTRDLPLLKRKLLTRGYWLRSQQTDEQLQEVMLQFGLMPFCKPFYRCIVCNGVIEEVAKASIESRLEMGTQASFNEFYQCGNCYKVYWKGSHYERIKLWLVNFKSSLTNKKA